MRTREQIQTEINKLQKEMRSLRDYRSEGSWLIKMDQHGPLLALDCDVVSTEINAHLRFYKEKQANEAVESIKHLLKLHALANQFNGKEVAGYCLSSDGEFWYMWWCEEPTFTPKFTKYAAEKACEVLNDKDTI